MLFLDFQALPFYPVVPCVPAFSHKPGRVNGNAKNASEFPVFGCSQVGGGKGRDKAKAWFRSPPQPRDGGGVLPHLDGPPLLHAGTLRGPLPV